MHYIQSISKFLTNCLERNRILVLNDDIVHHSSPQELIKRLIKLMFIHYYAIFYYFNDMCKFSFTKLNEHLTMHIHHVYHADDMVTMTQYLQRKYR